MGIHWGVIAGITIGLNVARALHAKKPRAADPRLGYRQRSASFGQVVPTVYGTTLIGAPALVRGYLEVHGGVWRQHQFALALCQGPIHGVRSVWLSDGGERDASKTTRVEWARMLEVGATLQPGALTGNLPTNPSVSRESAHDVTVVVNPETSRVLSDVVVTADGATGPGRIRLRDGSPRSFLPALTGAATLRIMRAPIYWNADGTEPVLLVRNRRLDGDYTIASITEREIVLTSPHLVNPVWAFMGGTNFALDGAFSLSSAAEGFRYPGIAYIRGDPLDLAALYRQFEPDTTLSPVFDAELSGLSTVPLAGPSGLDAEGPDVVADILGANYWAANVGETLETTIGAGGTSASGYRTYCRASGFFVSGAMEEQKPAADHLQDVLDATDSVALVSEGKIKILPLGDVPLTGNGATYTPNTVPLYDLGPAQILASGQQPMIRVQGRPDALAANVVAVEYRDRGAGGAPYRVSVETAFDAADIEEQAAGGGTGKVEAAPDVLHWIASPGHARQIAHLRLQRLRGIRNGQEFRLPWYFARIEGMDLVTLTDPAQGIDHVTVRVLEVGEDQDGEISVSSVDWPIGVSGRTAFTTSSSDTASVESTNPGQAGAPVVVPVPAILAGSTPQVWIGATGPGPLFGGCDVYLSADGATYSHAGTISGRSKIGRLTAALASGASLDTVNTAQVDVGESLGVLSGTTPAGRDALETLCWVNGELLAYGSATEGSVAHQYALATLRRGAYGTSIGSHSAGAPFVRIDAGVLRVALPPAMVGVPFYVKLVPFTLRGGGRPALADVTAHQVTVAAEVSPDPARTYRQTSAPTGTLYVGDIWYDTDDGNMPHRWSGSAWVAIPDGTRAETDLGNVPPGQVPAELLTPGQSNTDNLWPNPTSESAPPTGASAAVLASAEFAGRTASASAYAGGYIRRLSSPLFHSIPVIPGEEYVFSAQARSPSGGGTTISILTLNSSGGTVQGHTFSANTSGTGWQPLTVSLVVAEGAVTLGAYLWGEDYDAISLRRKVAGLEIVADSLRTTNYAEDGSGNPTAGAKLDHTGTALKVAPGNLQLGASTLAQLAQIIASVTVTGSGSAISSSGAFNVSSVSRVAFGTPTYAIRIACPEGVGVPVLVPWGNNLEAVALGQSLSSGSIRFDVGIRNIAGTWLDPDATVFTLNFMGFGLLP